MHKLLPFLLCLLIFSCAGNRTVSFNSVRPADIDVPADIKSIVMVDRTKFDVGGLNILEGVLTGELPDEDKAAVQSLMNALRHQLRTSDRFEVKLSTERLKGNSLTAAFPKPLSWPEVERLCARYGTDALLAVELFDTDFIVTETSKMVTRTVEKREVQVEEFYAEGVDNIKIGIRLYNPKTRSVEDQELFNRTGTWNASADSKAEALAALITKTQATQNLSGALGASYAGRIAPMNIFVNRTFRGKHKHSEAVAKGARYSEVDNWEAAINAWKTGLQRPKSQKVAGFLAYNIAVGYEALGDLNEAKYWAGKAYTDFGYRRGRSYVNQLLNRMRNEEIASQQLGGF
ncbi:MAG: DUF6340 family protein [Cytophagales bacterium]|nr:DUF6340 family protein [Cytophagales bacterium]